MLYGKVLKACRNADSGIKILCGLYDSCTLKTHRTVRVEFRLQIGILKLFK